jgi:UDP-2,3-diacylglucosamine hydrolase
LEAKKTYFASDFHLGLAAGSDPREREARVVSWLEEASEDAGAFFLLGDLFDFWWEYKTVIPKGFTRFLGKLASLTDKGISVHVFPGNHDMWMKDYLANECGVTIHHDPFVDQIGQEIFYLAHGEGLGSKRIVDRMLFAFFRNRVVQALFGALHPATGVTLGHAWSNSSRLAKHVSLPFLGEDREDLISHTREMAEKGCHARYYIYGHRHLPMTFDEDGRRIIILGDWFTCRRSYAVYDGKDVVLISEPLVL